MTALLLCIFPFWFGGGMRAMTGELWLWNCLLTHHTLVHTLLGFLLTYSGCGTYSQATLTLQNAYITGSNEFGSIKRE